MRGSLLAIGTVCLFFGMLSTIEVRADSDFKVTLIGTGSPIPRPDRFGPSTLFEAGDQKFLIDAGRGAPVRLWQVKVPPGKIDVLFLTHYHSDHTSGIPDLWLTGWLPPPFGQRAGCEDIRAREGRGIRRNGRSVGAPPTESPFT